jgi:histidinol-phosphate aminotransferase
MPNSTPPPAAEAALSDPPRLTRRHALLGAAALLVPFTPRLAIADATPVATAATDPILLNGNENPYGPSPAARQAIISSADSAPRYADASIDILASQIAAREGVPRAQVAIGSGSGELLRMAGLLASTTAPGSEVIAARPTYEELPEFAERLGLTLRWVAPDAAHRHDLPAMRAAIGERTSVVYVCNPNNPTGAAVTREALATFIRSVPVTIHVIVDEAYIDFADAAGVASVAPLVQQVPNLIVLRTFSKIHGLAGLRVGYAISSAALSKPLAELSLVWPNTTGIDAALASYNDHEFLQTTRAAILADRARVQAAIDRLGLPRAESQGNFVFFDTGRPVQEFRERMLAQGLKVGRNFNGYDNWSRTTIGRRNEVDRFLAALPGALKA